MLRLLEQPGDVTARDHFEPGHFTASAFVVGPGGDRLLLVWHGKLHRWLQPGGHVDPADRAIEAAARREVAEETGITDADLETGTPVLDLDVHAIPPLRGDPPHRHFDVRFLLQSKTLTATAASDARAVRWVERGGFAGVETDESVLRAARKLGFG
jgi:8-oxo-dGTP pyrophosphatase MutT (NUDIX family)